MPRHSIEPSKNPQPLTLYARRVKARHRHQIIFLLASFAVITYTAYLVYQAVKPKNTILGITSASDSQAIVLSDPLRQACLDAGGIPSDAPRGLHCTMGATTCPAAQLIALGNCSPSTSTPKPLPSPPPLENSTNTIHIYHATIKHIQPEVTPAQSSLRDYLVTALRLTERNVKLEHIHFDSRSKSPYDQEGKFNQSYYLTVSGGPLTTQSLYQDDITAIKLEPVDIGLLPQLLDSHFCFVDEDCAIRKNFCQYSAFNHFQAFRDAYACRTIIDSQGNARIRFDEAQQCQAEVVYQDAICQNNACVPNQEILKCIHE